MIYDSIVIGIGPAGIEAAIDMKRLNLNVLAIGKDFGALAKAKKIDNYFGVSDISGISLLMNGLKQAQDLGVVIQREEVLDISIEDCFKVKTDKTIYMGKTVLLALGKEKNRFNLAIPYEGKGVSYCASCDGFFFRNKKIGIIGDAKYLLSELDVLNNINKNVIVFTNGVEVSGLENYSNVIDNSEIISLTGEDNLKEITTKNSKYELDGLFIAMGSASSFTLAKHLGLAIKDDSIKVDENQKTNIKGIFAAGDCTGGIYQIAKAVGEGIIASKSIFNYLKEQK